MSCARKAAAAVALLVLAGAFVGLHRAAVRLSPPEAAPPAESGARVVIGTFNIENFSMTDPQSRTHYTRSDAASLARSILRSGADVLALQEIEGDATMRAFVPAFLPGWDFFGNDTRSYQDLYFLWNAARIEPVEGATAYYPQSSFVHEGTKKVFDRPPLKAVFREKSSGKTFTLVNVHLKSKFVLGARDRERAQQANTEKRRAQLALLNDLSERLRGKGPLFVLGDFNDDIVSDFDQVLTLSGGHSYDSKKSNLDHIVFAGIERSRLGEARETETRIERRSTKNRERPDHDIITVEVLLP